MSSELEKSKEFKLSGSDKFYLGIVDKLGATLSKYAYIPEICECATACKVLNPAASTKDEKIEYLLAVVMQLLQNVPNSPFLEEMFTNFLKDYIHFINPDHVYHLDEYYLTDDFIIKHKSEWLQDQTPKIRYI